MVDDAGASAPALVALMRGWHACLRDAAPVGSDPLLRLRRGAALLIGERAERVDAAAQSLLRLAGGGLQPPPPGFAGASLRPKVTLALTSAGGAAQLDISYFGQVPGMRVLGEVRAKLGALAYVEVRGGAGRAIHLLATIAEPARPLPVVMVEAGGQDFAIPIQFLNRALPAMSEARDAPAPVAEACLASSLGLTARASRRGRRARLQMAVGGRSVALRVDAILGHRHARVHGVGPLLGVIPWLLGVADDDEGPVLVVHPRRLSLRRAAND